MIRAWRVAVISAMLLALPLPATAQDGAAGMRRFSSSMAAMSCAEGPFGPGLRGRPAEEKGRRYLPSTRALWNLSSVAGLVMMDNRGMRCGRMNRVVSPSTRRSSVVRFGASCRERADQ